MFEVVRIDALRSRANGPVAQAEGSALHDFAFVDPAFVTVGCRFSVAEGPVRLTADGAVDFWSASVYSRRGDNVYSINDRSAVAGQFDLLVGTPEQLVDAQAASTDPGETVIPVEVDIDEGYLTLRALVDEESERPSVDAFMRSVTCATADPAAG
ncbi:DUF1254 domain-containing protein [Mangrovibrevibacter kandeliae]|uniref:DUF1254 domain-containing protein n=1 Tax=Mangrovibrevibacter kandeliae TaxID=2968473 RepID=UPI0021194535|nr:MULTISPECIES: hypothetical protein [unclassified Aurantimonas]MCQ8781069.1 hypothetical protein [Aurantimonas sp. CSK15Z-1]MCW4113850.1 hypothetical protein [Aurantimonas sp. MSK8Z-1]